MIVTVVVGGGVLEGRDTSLSPSSASLAIVSFVDTSLMVDREVSELSELVSKSAFVGVFHLDHLLQR